MDFLFSSSVCLRCLYCRNSSREKNRYLNARESVWLSRLHFKKRGISSLIRYQTYEKHWIVMMQYDKIQMTTWNCGFGGCVCVCAFLWGRITHFDRFLCFDAWDQWESNAELTFFHFGLMHNWNKTLHTHFSLLLCFVQQYEEKNSLRKIYWCHFRQSNDRRLARRYRNWCQMNLILDVAKLRAYENEMRILFFFAK